MTTAPQQVPVFTSARAAAGVLFTNDDGDILMVTPSYKNYLDIPGGYVEPGESPIAAARREVLEELSIVPTLGRLLIADWWTEGVEPDDGSKILFIFDGGTLSPQDLSQIIVDGTEIVGHRFVPTSILCDVTIPRLANRLHHAVAAKNEASIRYLEGGEEIL